MRERKRRQTRERISEAAMTLFLERGFEATTVDDIAAAADVSKRSFFDYFATKEDVVFAWQDNFGTALAAAVAARPPGEPLTQVVEEALVEAVIAATQPRAMAIGELIHATPALGARDQLKYARLEQTLAAALADRVTDDADKPRARLIAMVTIGAMRIGGEGWRSRPQSESIESYVRKIFRTVWTQLGELSRDRGGR
ncbi:TetR/AcrR family transcriptional regulator [Phreatobacter stygius]|uniref:TetR/AcrR family transcriptional regulator n=1 Tax=Phreatobacter stygius TaxID=1940610 RepID=UPI001FEB3E29|nr:TetR/AcrR family transcriptional regulator [Phreatobacter stygius]